MSLLNKEEILEFHGQKDFLESARIIPEIKNVIHRAIIGGTQAWLSINDDDEYKMKKKSRFSCKKSAVKDEL
jgi:hypothetical protein